MIGRKIKYLQAKQSVIGREIPTVLKIAMDNIILELSFVLALYSKKKHLNLNITFKKKKLLLIVFVSSSVYIYPEESSINGLNLSHK